MEKFKLKRSAAGHVRKAGTPQQKLLFAVLRAFLSGIGAALLLLAAACLIAGVGAAVPGAVLAVGIGRQRLLCGLGCGVFYAACLAAASAVSGELALTDANLALLCVLVFSGMFGGVLTALRSAPRAG